MSKCVYLEPVETLLTDRAEGLRAAAAIEERKAAGNITLVNQYRFTANVIDDLREKIAELAPVPGYTNEAAQEEMPPAAEAAEGTTSEDGEPTTIPHGSFVPSEADVDSIYEAFREVFRADTTAAPPTTEEN